MQQTKPILLKPQEAARVLGSNAQSVRVRMQRDSFQPPIGTCCKLSRERYSYEIYPGKLAEFLNISVDDVFERLSDSNEQT